MAEFKNLPLWTPCASIALAFCWLLPNANPPWLAFHKDAWAGMVFLLVVIGYLARGKRGGYTLLMEPVSLALLVMAAWSILQWGIGQVYFFGDAILGSLYFLSAAICIWVAGSWERSNPYAVGDFIFTSTLIAALVTTGIMAAQWLRLDVHQVWIQGIPPWGRPFGNLIQPNNAASLLNLGLVSLMWFLHKGKVRMEIAWMVAIYLVVFLAVSGSRSGYVTFALMALSGTVLLWRRPECRVLRWAGISLLALLVAGVLVLQVKWVSLDVMPVATAESVLQRDLTSARFQIYRAYIAAVADAPLTGYGFNQAILAQIQLGAQGVFLPGLVTWSHNAFLDLAIWFGAPGALLAICATVFVAHRFLKTESRDRRTIYLAGVFSVVSHGMVELPLSYAYFLLPTAMLTGAMLSDVNLPSIRLPKFIVLGLIVASGIAFTAICYDYFRIESSFYAWRFKQNRVGNNHSSSVPEVIVLDQMNALLIGLHSNALSNDQMAADFRRAVLRHPSAAAIQHLAEILVRRGDIQAAQETADFGWLISDRKTRRSLALRWSYLGSQDASFRAVSWRGDEE